MHFSAVIFFRAASVGGAGARGTGMQRSENGQPSRLSCAHCSAVAQHRLHTSGSHSLAAAKHGHARVRHVPFLHEHPWNLFTH